MPLAINYLLAPPNQDEVVFFDDRRNYIIEGFADEHGLLLAALRAIRPHVAVDVLSTLRVFTFNRTNRTQTFRIAFSLLVTNASLGFSRIPTQLYFPPISPNGPSER